MEGHGDLNNSHAARTRVDLVPDPAYSGRSFAIPKDADEPDIRERYRPFLLNEANGNEDWVAQLELSTTLKMVESEIINQGQPRLRILVLYGSMRNRSVSSSSPLLLKHNVTIPEESARAGGVRYGLGTTHHR
jgi:arsenic resistance protein ArsH